MIRLLPLDEPRLEALLRQPDASLAELCSNGPEIKSFLLPVLQQSLEFQRRGGVESPWHGYVAVELPGNQLVGTCAFKGKPTDTGEVEIAYLTVPGFEGRGYATRMAEALQGIAFQSPAVRRVIAHTLPEPNASGRVLQKSGLTLIGEVTDAEDGRVWRWAIAKPPVGGDQ